ncbi:hypothetical protein V6N13_088173 [Hibiscus sabdariffa]|uniref:Uncharacterized protein n=1 Tax=Hibiscus sabdariffa TaxID=183260 RepID=A0ABR2FYI8_9ROSI
MMTREVNEFGRRLFTLRPGEDCERRPIPSGKPRLSVVQWHLLHYGRDVVCPSLSTEMQIVRGTMALPHGY